jgi:hypothetical protein
MDVTSNGNLKSINQLLPILGVRISVQCHSFMASAFKRSSKAFQRPGLATMHFNDFLLSKKKSSRPFRKILTTAWIETSLKKSKIPLENFCKIAGTENILPQISKWISGKWTLHFLPSDIKTFLFKLHHNILGLNSRINHINANRDPACTFCLKANNLPAERETFQHFFWECPTSNNLIIKFLENFFRADLPASKELFLYGTALGMQYNNTTGIVCGIFQYTFWAIKLKKRFPTWPLVKNEFLYHLNTALGASKKFKQQILTCNLHKQYRDEIL